MTAGSEKDPVIGVDGRVRKLYSLPLFSWLIIRHKSITSGSMPWSSEGWLLCKQSELWVKHDLGSSGSSDLTSQGAGWASLGENRVQRLIRVRHSAVITQQVCNGEAVLKQTQEAKRAGLGQTCGPSTDCTAVV